MKPYSVMTVCTGNICRSPMAEIILRKFIDDAGLSDSVTVDSTGVSNEECGHSIDPRAQKVLRAHGYDVPFHRARQITTQEAAKTDLLLPMTADHKQRLLTMVPPEHRSTVHLYRSFDPSLPQPQNQFDESIDLVDPWYGGARDFNIAIDQIEHGAPFIVDYIKSQL